MTPEFDAWVEEVGAAAAAPALPRSSKDKPGADPKWRLGDVLLRVPPEWRDEVADKVGLNRSYARVYAETSQAFPLEVRTVRASWSAHRELRHDRDRIAKLHDGMTMRQATLAAGRKAFDQKADHLQDPEHRVARMAQALLDDGLLELFVDHVANMKKTRAARKAVVTARELRTEYRRLKELLRQARETKSPLETALVALVQVNEMRQLMAGVGVINEEYHEDIPRDRWRELVSDIQLLVTEAEDVMEGIEANLDPDEPHMNVIEAQAREATALLAIEQGSCSPDN